MKKMISLLLAVVLVFGTIPVAAFATEHATEVNLTADKTAVKAGEEITLTLSIDKAIENAYTWQWNILYNANLFDVVSMAKNQNGYRYTGVNKAPNDADAIPDPYKYALVYSGSKLQLHTLPAGELCTLTLRAKSDINEETTAQFFVNCNAVTTGEEVEDENGNWVVQSSDYKANVVTNYNWSDLSKLPAENSSSLGVTVQKEGAVVEKFAITTAGTTNGTITPTVNGIAVTEAAEGDKVTLTVTPVEGYMLDTLTYTPAAAEGQTAQAVDIKDTKSFTMPSANVTVNATFKAITAGYNVAMGADLTGEKAVTANQPITIPITVGHKAAENQTAETNFKSYELTINYGVGNLKLTNVTSTDSDYSVVNDETTGIAVIRRFGDLINLGDGAINLNFVANKVGTHTVTITDAKVGNSSSAKNDDIPDAEILDASIQIEVGGYNVNLDTNVFEGDQTVDPAMDYQFEAKDKNYDYTSVTAYYTDAEGNKQNVNVTDNKDGTYTIAANQIEGDVTIEYTREGKLFDISLGDDMEHTSGTVDVTVDGNTVQKIQYMTDYTAVLEKKDSFTYQVTATKNGETFTDFTYDETTGTVTVEGKFITGDIVFDSGKESEQPTAYTVTFTGNCMNHASGDASVDPGVDYSFTLNRAPGYTYTISYAVGQVTEETVFTPMDMTSDQTLFTIDNEKITGNLTIKIEGTSDLQVTVNEYVAMRGDQVAYLVTATQTLAEEKTLGYEDGVDEQNNQKYSPMYYRDYTEEVTDEAGQTTSKTVRKYLWLDIQQKPADGEEAAFNAEVAKAKISVLEATSTELTETFNVNQSTSTDINDAQLVYDMYNALYGDFQTVSRMKYLLADLSGDNKLSVQDAAAIVRYIINPDTNQAG